METLHISNQYKKKALPLNFTRKILRKQQQKIYEKFTSIVPIHPNLKVLDYGVNASLSDPQMYFFEYNYPYKENIVASGLESSKNFNKCFQQILYIQVCRKLPLPFEENQFDLIFCNAVIEHVGSRLTQEQFLHELIRSGKTIFITTPNRWYPIELHTVLPLFHLLPQQIYRKIFSKLGFEFFSKEENLNLLDNKSLAKMIPSNCRYKIHNHRFGGFISNLLLHIKKTQS
jgi:SAM-dependent methyltransferase